ncbi:amino acid adenylation domain-containing protein [Streptomyces sp. NBC_00047]|uniref:non-ribosomal peptide synthetase n=1 Tax=Streptomyces sp. NBC_00047 TaxID=2975627 RepID=UPI00224D0E25|nr:non-ribosomal peptide synthetase [Streptomyces sp. NBC_00047]MCX5612902.1 amino acid adenylation domain-containing protein [Streptomyces sp. NBC_00047]
MTAAPISFPVTRDPATAATALRPRLTRGGVPGHTRRSLPLPAASRTALRGAGGHPVDELVLLCAAAALALAAAEDTDTPALTVTGPAGPVGVTVTTAPAGGQDDGTAGALLRRIRDELLVARPAGARAGTLTVAAEGTARPAPAGEALLLTLEGTGEDRTLHADVDTGRCETWFADAVLRVVAHLLAQLGDPGRELAALTLADATDRETVKGWGRAGFWPPATPATLLERLDRGHQAGGDSLAVVTGGGAAEGPAELGHAQLRAESLRAARRLHHAYGVGRGDRVALLVGKGRHALTALLGTVRTGAAYVPLDPAQPEERLAAVLADVGAAALVAEPEHLELARALAGRTGLRLLSAADLAADTADLAALPEEEPEPPRPEDTAYVIYTSGSTGQPKGVVIRHSAIDSYLAWKHDYHRLSPDTCLLQVPALSFDSSVSDVFSVLGAGGALVLVDGVRRLDGAHLRGLAERYTATHVTFVPSLYAAVLDELAAARTLRVVTVAGEAMPGELVARHQLQLPRTRLINEYGPTENSVGATAFDYPAHPLPGTPIGWPLSHTAVEVLDGADRPVPPGFPGQLHFSGPGLADGYLHRPELTAAAFPAAPEQPGGRRYRSGDRGWWQPNGTLQFLGRADDQVKIRGNRVELGDVEAALAALPAVEAAVAVVCRGAGDRPSLVAFVTGPAAATTADVHAYAGTVLPAPLVPDRILPLDRVPLTTNGKIDRRELAERAQAAAPADEPVPAEAPESPQSLEERVGAVFREILGVDEIGPDDNFFACGGHSLLAIDVIAALEQRHGLVLGIDELLDGPSVNEACAALRGRGADDGGPGAAATAEEGEDHPLSAAQHQLWTLARLDDGADSIHHLTDVFRIDGPLDERQVAQALADEAACAQLLRARFFVRDGEPRQRFVYGDRPPLTVLWPAPGTDTAATLRGEAQRPFDLERQPPLRAVLLRLSPTSALLALTVHHIACDGESAVLLADRVFARLRALRTGAAAPRPADGSYLTHIAREAAALAGPEAERARAHWHTELAGPLPFPLLPADGERGAAPGPGGSSRIRLSAGDSRAVRTLARTCGTSMYGTGLTALAELLQRFTAERRILVGTPVTRRDDPSYAGVIGPFLNTVVLTCEVAPDLGFAERAAATRSAVASAMAHRSHPFERLVNELPGARDGGRTPLFTVMFTADERGAAGTGDGSELDAGPGLTVRREQYADHAAEFELSFHLDNSAELLELTAEYDGALFSAARATRLLRHWADLLLRAAADPGRTPAGTPLPDAESAELAALADNCADRPGARITDAAGRPVPVGVPGDLSTGAGATGLRAHWSERGELVPRGRAGRLVPDPDRPGTHLDPAEAELLLLAHPSVRAAEVRAAAPGEPGPLTAHVTAHPGHTVSPGALRTLLRRALPLRLTPATVHVTTEADRQTQTQTQTPAPAPAQVVPPVAQPAAGPVELVAQAVAEALGHARVGPDEDFFDLGGGSLDAVAVAARLRIALGRDVSPRLVFDSRTPAAIAEAIAAVAPAPGQAAAPDQATAVGHDDGPVRGSVTGPAPLSAEQTEIWQALQGGAAPAAFVVFEALRVTARTVDPHALRQAVEHTAARHDALTSRLVVTDAGPRWQPLTVPRTGWAEDDLSALPEAERAAALDALAQRHLEQPFDLAAGLLLRARLVRLADHEHVLLLAVHHIAVDGRSMELLVNQTAAAYEEFAAGGWPADPAGEPPLRLADVARWQQERTTAGADGDWRRALAAGPPPQLPLPYDRPRLVRGALMPTELPFAFPAPGAGSFGRADGLSPFTLGLTALVAALARGGGDTDGTPDEVWLATVLSTRSRPGLADVVGPLTGTALLRVPIAGARTHRELARAVGHALLAAHDDPAAALGAVAGLAEGEFGVDRARLSQILVVAQEDAAPAPGALFTPDGSIAATRPTATAFDLVWSLRTGEDDADGVLTYKGELFDDATAQGLVDRTRQALEALIAHPDEPWQEQR